MTDKLVPINQLGYYEVEALFTNGVIGTKEFRNWIAKENATFAEVRDADVDRTLEELAKFKEAQLDAARELAHMEKEAPQ